MGTLSPKSDGFRPPAFQPSTSQGLASLNPVKTFTSRKRFNRNRNHLKDTIFSQNNTPSHAWCG